MLSRTLKIAEPPNTGPPPSGSAHWYFTALSRTASLYTQAIPHGVSPSNAALVDVHVDRQTAAVAAITGASKMSIIHSEMALPPPPRFEDESSIAPSAVWACHRAVQLGLINVAADNKFYPHNSLTFGEATKLIDVLNTMATISRDNSDR
jgi:hypothetical protein